MAKRFDVICYCGSPRGLKSEDMFGIVPHDTDLPWEWGVCASHLTEEDASESYRRHVVEAKQTELDILLHSESLEG